ncbi:hypothetical protein [Rhodoligotrophos defluvii]|uniref:hypothetical protein n=1 Tax=Rhodoligotrophos defluvii TaxID=2561934 RepID=UPI0019601CB4|nr:hypothetical protein [Rhodoligotrophos defluvii]
MTTSLLFRYVEALQAGRPWGSLLDAGTGPASARWVSGLQTIRWTGVTGAPSMVEKVQLAVGERLRPQDRLVLGNWTDPGLLAGEVFETVLADYLLGAASRPMPSTRCSNGCVPWSGAGSM